MSTELKEITDLRIVEFNEFEVKLSEFKGKYTGVVYDLSDKKQDKQARSDRMAIGKVVSALDAAHKDIKAPLLAKTKLLDGERKRIKDDLQCVQSKIGNQIKKHEDGIREAAEAIQLRIDSIVNVGLWDAETILNSAQLTERLGSLKAIIIDDSFSDRKGDAAIAKDNVSQRLSGFISDALEYESEQSEIEVRRIEKEKIERAAEDEKIRINAEAKAKVNAQAEIDKAKRHAIDAEKRAKDAEAKTLLDASEKERLALEKAERLELEAKQAKAKAARDAAQAIIDQKKAVADAKAKSLQDQQAKDKAEADAKKAREADKAHKSEVMQRNISALANWGINPMIAKSVIEIISKGALPDVHIDF